MTAKEKMTAPIASVGADVEQPLSNKLTNQSIADLPGKGNLQATNNAENTEKSASKKNPDDLETVSMMELYDTAYPPKLPIVDGLLYNGTYLFVGSPKIGKSFFMAQIGYHISEGLPLWGFSVRQKTDTIFITECFQLRYNLVIAGITEFISTDLSNLLKSINDNQSCVFMLCYKRYKLFFQSVIERFRFCSEIEILTAFHSKHL